jgi:hypothetical protein
MYNSKLLNLFLVFVFAMSVFSFKAQAQNGFRTWSIEEVQEVNRAEFLKKMKSIGYDCALPSLNQDVENLLGFVEEIRQLSSNSMKKTEDDFGRVTKKEIVAAARKYEIGWYDLGIGKDIETNGIGFGTRTFAPNGVSSCPCENAVKKEREEVTRLLLKATKMDSKFYSYIYQAEAAALRYKEEFMKCGKKVYAGVSDTSWYGYQKSEYMNELTGFE